MEHALSFTNLFQGKTVLITGHSGFKGGWLSVWMEQLGADVVGVSLPPPTRPSFFEICSVSDFVDDNFLDIRDKDCLAKCMQDVDPDFVFHLAAQPIVRRAYADPHECWTTNVIGTLNLLESVKATVTKKCCVILITSDKCYENKEWVWGYRETDQMGGADPYSASKGATELLISSYVRSYFAKSDTIRVATARAGNVIGGGDWATDRLVPDSMKAWSRGESVTLRSPLSTRPWQHVVEPVGGYIWLAAMLSTDHTLHGEAFNFGPSAASEYTVEEVVRILGSHWDRVKWKVVESNRDDSLHEAGLLKLNCDKARRQLGWRSILTTDEALEMTVRWYKIFYENSGAVAALTIDQVAEYAERLESAFLKNELCH